MLVWSGSVAILLLNNKWRSLLYEPTSGRRLNLYSMSLLLPPATLALALVAAAVAASNNGRCVHVDRTFRLRQPTNRPLVATTTQPQRDQVRLVPCAHPRRNQLRRRRSSADQLPYDENLTWTSGCSNWIAKLQTMAHDITKNRPAEQLVFLFTCHYLSHLLTYLLASEKTAIVEQQQEDRRTQISSP